MGLTSAFPLKQNFGQGNVKTSCLYKGQDHHGQEISKEIPVFHENIKTEKG
jgi:hypothetical protein